MICSIGISRVIGEVEGGGGGGRGRGIQPENLQAGVAGMTFYGTLTDFTNSLF